MALCDSHSGSHCHSLADSGTLWINSDRLSGPLLGSQRTPLPRWRTLFRSADLDSQWFYSGPIKSTVLSSRWIFRRWPDLNPFSAAVSSGQDYVEGDCLADQWGLSVKTGSTNEEPPASQPSPSEPTILSPQLHRLLLTWAGTYNEWLKLRPDFIVWKNTHSEPWIPFRRAIFWVLRWSVSRAAHWFAFWQGNAPFWTRHSPEVSTNRGSWAESETLSL